MCPNPSTPRKQHFHSPLACALLMINSDRLRANQLNQIKKTQTTFVKVFIEESFDRSNLHYKPICVNQCVIDDLERASLSFFCGHFQRAAL